MPIAEQTEEAAEQPDFSGTLHMLGPEGDVELKWNRRRREEVRHARRTFDDLRAKGYLAYKVEGDTKGTVLTEFDETAERIIITPPLAGG